MEYIRGKRGEFIFKVLRPRFSVHSVLWFFIAVRISKVKEKRSWKMRKWNVHVHNDDGYFIINRWNSYYSAMILDKRLSKLKQKTYYDLKLLHLIKKIVSGVMRETVSCLKLHSEPFFFYINYYVYMINGIWKKSKKKKNSFKTIIW